MQPFTKQLIFDRIADSGYVFWTLYLCNGFKSQSHILSYYGVDFDSNDTPETMIEKSIAKLDNVVSSFPPDAVFSIELKNSKSANGNGIIGAFQFTNSQESAQNPQNLSGAPVSVPYLTEETLKGITAQMEENFNRKFEQLKQESLLRERENELKRKQDELATKFQEVADLKKSYDSSVAKSADVLFQAGKKLIMAFVPTLIPADTPAALAGTQSQPAAPQESAPAQKDDKADAVDELAAFVYDNFTLNDIQQLKQRIKDAKLKVQKTPESVNKPGDESDDDNDGEYEND